MITKDRQLELTTRFPTLDAAEAHYRYIVECDRDGGRRNPGWWGGPLPSSLCDGKQPEWIPISQTAVDTLPRPASMPAPSHYTPLVDPALITDQERFERDLAQCRDLAVTNTASNQALTTGVEGAAAGAAFGALMGLAVGLKPGQLAPAGALGGGIGGLGAGAVNQEATFQQIYKNCMIGRGWQVLR
ncbi:MAG: hypothetical protein KGL31_11125 [candidate division NC10 bacterium]|nr:hypothetical protein [candidate division NC10 bacterium]MDE2322444.1 hypothetical protein [candidate division NC10 bacterium]